MRSTPTVAVLFVILFGLAPIILSAEVQENGLSSSEAEKTKLDPRRVPRSVTVYRDGLPHEFTLTRSAEAASPITALRTKVGKKFGDLRYKNFFTLDGKPLDPFAQLPENVRER
jgi:hypothetical protein